MYTLAESLEQVNLIASSVTLHQNRFLKFEAQCAIDSSLNLGETAPLRF